MRSTTAVTLDFQRPNYNTAYAVQDDQLSRWIHADLTDGGTAWTPPSGVVMLIRYAKPDGTVGLYDALENGDSAYVISGSSVEFGLAAQCLTVAGTVMMEIAFYNNAGERLSAFSFRLVVERNPATDAELESNDYFNILAQEIAGLLNATTHPPIIDPTTKNWMLWDEDSNAYVVSSFSSVGLTGPAPEISSQVRSWQNSSSGTTIPSGSWSSTRIAGVPGQFLWEKIVTTYSTAEIVTEYIVAYQGNDGTGAPGNMSPQMAGVAAAGTATAFSRQDHVHPAQTAELTKIAGGIDVATALSNRARSVLLLGDSYGLDTANWTGWQTALQSLVSVAAKSAVGGSGFVGDPNVDTFLEQLEALTVADKTAVTDIVILGGYNDAGVSATESAIQTAADAFMTYVRAQYPLARVHFGFVAVDYNNTGMMATLTSYRFLFERVCAKAGISFIRNAPYILLNRSLLFFSTTDANSGSHPSTAGNAALAAKIAEYLTSGGFDVVYGENLLGLAVYAKNGDVTVFSTGYSLSSVLPAMTYPFNSWSLLADLSIQSNLLWGPHSVDTTFQFWAPIYTPNGYAAHALFRIFDKGLFINPLNTPSGLLLSSAGWICPDALSIPMQANY